MRLILVYGAPTLFGPIYFALTRTPWWSTVIWAAFCALVYLLQNRALLNAARNEAFDSDIPRWYHRFADFALYLGVTGLLSIASVATFFLVRAIS